MSLVLFFFFFSLQKNVVFFECGVTSKNNTSMMFYSIRKNFILLTVKIKKWNTNDRLKRKYVIYRRRYVSNIQLTQISFYLIMQKLSRELFVLQIVILFSNVTGYEIVRITTLFPSLLLSCHGEQNP